MKRKMLRIRIRVLSAIVIALSLVLLGRLYYLQVDQSEYYLAQAESQYVHTKTNIYSRGSIYFTTRDGEELSAAAIRAGYVLAINPEQITREYDDICEQLQPYFDITIERCVERLSVPDRTYLELASRLTEVQQEEIDALDLDGVQLYRNQWRYYPGDTLSARTVGFVGYMNDLPELRGIYGLERYYDDILYREQKTRSVNFFAELFSNLGDVAYQKEDTGSGDIITTLEPSVSRKLDEELAAVQETYNSKLTGAVIMDPMTGEIIAMNAIPTFNLNDRTGLGANDFRNPLVEDVYEMGSIIKPLTMAAGLDSGVVTAKTTYYDAGSLELDTFTIRNYDGRGRGTVPMQEVLNQSLNTGVAHIVTLMGKDRFREYFKSYKLGSETGIDLPNETYGLISNLESPRDVEYATASFGQGIAMTPIETTRALATLGNGGRLVTPHIVKEIRYDNGHVKEVQFPVGEQVLSPETSEEISRMLTVVVDDALKGGKVAMPNHTVGAKTGTAQIPDPVNGGYYDDRYLHSFFGYFPAYEPRFIVFMYTVEPQGVRYASETLTDPFMNIVRYLINYYSIPPDR
jgi:cell division protein FtsI/penicillin-binding protein 2